MADASLPTPHGQMPSARDVLGWVLQGEVALALGVVGIVVLLILPIPSFMLDGLLAISITSAVLILMTSLLIKKPLEFTGFPMVLLVTTLYRLALNIPLAPPDPRPWARGRPRRGPHHRSLRQADDRRQLR